MKLLDGKAVRDEKIEILKEKVKTFSFKPVLEIITIGDREESRIYVEQKRKFGEKIGVSVRDKNFLAESFEKEIIEHIESLNNQEEVLGIIVQLPIPDNFNQQKILDTILEEKDVDGLTSQSKEGLVQNEEPHFVPATARGVIELLEYYKFDFKGTATVIGQSDLTGKPIFYLLRKKGMEVFVCDENTKDIKTLSQKSDLLISATGMPRLIDESFVSSGQWVVDVGFSKQEAKTEDSSPKWKITGDVDFEKVKDVAEAITPVPGGVGPMTVLALFKNLLHIPFD